MARLIAIRKLLFNRPDHLIVFGPPMRIYTPCMQCVSEGHPAQFTTLELRDSGLYPVSCSQGHESVTLLQAHKFEVLFDLAAYAILDGYYRDAVSSFTSALEQFYEFYVDLHCHKLGVAEEEFAASWKRVSRLSERQYGAFIFTYLSATKRAPKLLPETAVEFRNKVIHQGKIPSREEAIDYGERVAETIVPIIRELKTTDEDQVQAAVMRHVAKLHKQITVPKVATMGIATMVSLLRTPSDPQPSLLEWIETIRKQRAPLLSGSILSPLR
jgi:hypothetical protein